MFEIEEQAANIDETVETESQSTPPVEPVDQTKAFAQRLKEEKAKVKQEIAESFGYESWQSYVDAQTNNKILDKGLDPDSIRETLKDLVKTDPDYVEAMNYKKEKEALEKELFASNSLKQLNETYGTNYKSVNDLDAETVRMWNEGTPLEKAFAANNISIIVDNAIKKSVAGRDSGKSHLKTVTGSTEQSGTRDISQEELRVARAFGLDETKFKEYIKNQNK